MEKEGHENLRACIRIHVYSYAYSRSAYAYFMHAYEHTCMHTHARVPKTMKDEFFAFKTWFGTNLTFSRSRSKPLFFDYIKP